MNIPIEFDQRYVVNQKDVDKMRKLRKKGIPYNKIAKIFKVSFHTVYYWTNANYRKRKQKINAKRTRKGIEKKIATERQTRRRKEKWDKYPESRIELDYWSAISETRTNRMTSKGRTIEQLKKEYNETKSITNQKIF